VIGRKYRKKNVFKSVAIGSAVAAGAGYVAGILTAPKSGKQTRKDIKDRADKSRADAEKELKKLHTDLDKVIKDAKSAGGKAGSRAQKEFNDITTRAKDAKEKAREVLSAIHEGDAEDKDLKKAVKDASAALGHLKDYLKK
jgi:gas vesicle protein